MERKGIIVDDDFALSIATHIIECEGENDPQSVTACKRSNDWPQWNQAIEIELDSLKQREVFGPVVHTPKGVKPVGYKWVFVKKRNEKNEIVRYKARLVAQGFSQRPGIDYDETYSPVMDATTFRFLISLTAMKGLDMQLMDVVTAYLYGAIDRDIYMKIPEGYTLPQDKMNRNRDLYSIKIIKSLYGLKQSGRMWYNRLSEFLIHLGFTNNEVCPCIFIRARVQGFVIIAVYVDDLNIIGTPREIAEISGSLTNTFEMKDLGKTKFCLGLQIEHLRKGILLHQATYTENLLKRFNLDKCYPLLSPMVVRSLDVQKDPFRPLEEGEDILGPEFPYLSAIGALLYLANCTRPDIAFAVNLLARHSAAPTKRHWAGIKHLLRYLQGSKDLGLYYERGSTSMLTGYADAGYRSDPHKEKSQTGYVFTYGGTAISWKSVKQTLTAVSTNHSEILAVHEASRECVWLRDIIQHILSSTKLESEEMKPTTIYEDNAACVAQLQEGYIKGDRTKHISPKFFFTHELHKHKQVDVSKIRSSENLADLFTKSLPTCTFIKLVRGIGMRRHSDLQAK